MFSSSWSGQSDSFKHFRLCWMCISLSYGISVLSEGETELIPFTLHFFNGFFQWVLFTGHRSNLFQPKAKVENKQSKKKPHSLLSDHRNYSHNLKNICLIQNLDHFFLETGFPLNTACSFCFLYIFQHDGLTHQRTWKVPHPTCPGANCSHPVWHQSPQCC